MRVKVINYLKNHPKVFAFLSFFLRLFLNSFGFFVFQKKEKIIFSCFGGRRFDDSPKAIYEEILSDKRFDGYEIVWCFANPSDFEIPRGKKVRIDSFSFFVQLYSSKIWVSNTGIDRGLGLRKKGIIRIETWHGTPLKKICSEENGNSLDKASSKKKIDKSTIRCAQSVYDLEIFSRVFNASKESFLLCDLPRNDALVKGEEKASVLLKKKELGIDERKKVILYMPTYREYLLDKDMNTYIAPPIDLKKWKDKLGDKYVLLVRAHYAVNKSLGLSSDGFVFDVSNYPSINDLYLMSDAMISDYSSSFFDYAILEKPMYCFAYDLEEYERKRGLYLDITKELPCHVCRDEESLLNDILDEREKEKITNVRSFKSKYAPYCGSASKTIVSELAKRIEMDC